VGEIGGHGEIGPQHRAARQWAAQCSQACLSSLTVRPRATSGLSRSWCSSASISLFAISCGRGADLALAAASSAQRKAPRSSARCCAFKTPNIWLMSASRGCFDPRSLTGLTAPRRKGESGEEEPLAARQTGGEGEPRLYDGPGVETLRHRLRLRLGDNDAEHRRRARVGASLDDETIFRGAHDQRLLEAARDRGRIEKPCASMIASV
jgi:hypothetical protein